MKIPSLFRLFVLQLPLIGLVMADDGVTDIGSRRELFVDHALIERMDQVELRLQEPRRETPAFYFDRPYEGKFSAYATIIPDGDLWRMYYRGLPSAGEERVARTCYAESRNGIIWTKPNLGLYEYEGSTDNNIVFGEDSHLAHNFSPFVDTRPGVPADERFKAISGIEEKGIAVFASADGLNWRRWGPDYVFTQGMFDSHNVVFWSDHEQAYVCYFRTWTGEGYTGWRTISRTTSPDLLNWTDPVVMDFGDTPMEHLYTNGTQPYYRAPHIYVGLAKRFLPEKAALDPVVEQSLLRNPKRGGDTSDSVLLTTRGGGSYDRTFMEAFVRPGPSPADWAARDNTPGLGLIPAPDGRRMYFYRLSHYAQATAHLSRYSLRLDGFVSVNAPFTGGELLTKPIRFSGDQLEINYQSSAAGEVHVELQDLDGQAIPGFELDACELIFGDEIARVVRWEGDPDLAALAGQPVHLRFVMRDADLFSYRFGSHE
jgi:hypothetical protein